MPDTALAIPDPGDDSRADRSYEVELGDDPPSGPAVYADITAPPAEFRPVIPGHLRTLTGVRSAASRHARIQLHKAGYHGLRSPRYALEASGWALVGIFR